MTGTIIAVVLAAALAIAATWLRRAGRRPLGYVVGIAVVAPALVAVRDLPGPVIDGVLIAGLLGAAAVTAWPLLRRSTDRTGRRGGS